MESQRQPRVTMARQWETTVGPAVKMRNLGGMENSPGEGNHPFDPYPLPLFRPAPHLVMPIGHLDDDSSSQP